MIYIFLLSYAKISSYTCIWLDFGRGWMFPSGRFWGGHLFGVNGRHDKKRWGILILTEIKNGRWKVKNMANCFVHHHGNWRIFTVSYYFCWRKMHDLPTHFAWRIRKKDATQQIDHWILQFFLKHRSYLASQFDVWTLKGVFHEGGIWILSLYIQTSTGFTCFLLKFWKDFHPHFAMGILLTPSLGPDQLGPQGGLKGSHGVKGKLRSEGDNDDLGGCVW